MQFVFPADPLNSKKLDSAFVSQAEALPQPYALLSLEEDKLMNVIPGEILLYRGWMMNPGEYHSFSLLAERHGALMFTSVAQYLNTHHIPNWYPLLKEFTPETYVIENSRLAECDLVAELNSLGWGTFFIKDYVKSLKTSRGAIITTAEEAPELVDMMGLYRGSIEGGLCVRKYEQFFDEKRFFIMKGQVFSSKPYSDLVGYMLREVSQRIDSPFFSVDIAYGSNGRPRVVELGDGQVSGLVGSWTPELLSDMFKKGGIDG